jgi:uncharacterized membrane protein
MSDEVEFKEVGPGDSISDDDRLWALLGYILPIIALIALLIEEKKDRPFIRYNAIHSLMLAVITIILSVTACLWVLPWIYSLYLGVKAYQNEWVVVPFLTDFAKNQGWLSENSAL